MHSTLNPSRFGARRQACAVLAAALLSSMGAHAQTQTGRLRAIVVTSAARSRSLPDIPTVAERGFPGFQAGSWMGVFAPKGTPEAVIATLKQAVNEIIAVPAMQAPMIHEGADPVGGTPAMLGQFTQKEFEKWRALVRELGATVE